MMGRRAHDLAVELGVGREGLICAEKAWRMWQGGNQWSAWDSYLSFFQDVAKLPIDYTAYNHWRALAEHSGPRIVHADFCMISDRPEILTQDEQNRPHNDTGPFCRWRDGSALYAVHGVHVPAWVVEHPETITVTTIDAEPNAEVRRVMMDRYGQARYVIDSGAVVVNEETDERGLPMALLRREGADGPMAVVRLTNSTPDPDGSYRTYHVRVDPRHATCFAARNAGYRMAADARFAVQT